MQAARAFESAEPWIELPAPNLGRYLLTARRRAANDNRRRGFKTFPVLPIGVCVALSGALTLIVALIR